MKKSFLAIFIFGMFNHFSSTAQSTTQLDNLNGYKNFKFGVSSTSIKNIIQNKSTFQLKNVTDYRYIGNDLQYFAGIRVENVELHFFKNKLYQISINFGNLDTEYKKAFFEVVQTTLVSNFGSNWGTVKQNEQAKILNGAIWDGKYVQLEHIRMNFGEHPGYNSTYGHILFTNKSMNIQQMQSELN